MKGLVFFPKMYQTRPTFDHRLIFEGFASERGWPVVYGDTLPFTPEVLVLFGVPQHNRPGFLVNEVMDLPKSTKIIVWSQDIQTYDSTTTQAEQAMLYDRYDLILCARPSLFKTSFPNFTHKMRTLFQAFAPGKFYTELEINDYPIMKCLVSGSKFEQVYPFRHMVATKGSKGDFEVTPPWFKIGRDYARLLHAHMCCFSDASIFKYCLRKTFEITAAGSLLVAEDCEDMREAGFSHDENYIAVTPENVFDTVSEILDSPGDFLNVRNAGRRFTLEAHTVEKRIEQMNGILDKELGI